MEKRKTGKHRLLLMELLSNLVAFVVFFNIFAFVFALDNGYINWSYLLLVVPFVFMFFLRKKVKKMRYFLTIHFSILALPFVALSDIRIFVIHMAFAIAVSLYSIHRKSKGEWNMQGSSAVLVLILLTALSFLYASYLPDIGGIGVFLNISSLITLASVVLYIHLDNMQFSLDLVGIAHHGNTMHTSSVSNVLITVFLIIIVIFGALSVFFPSEAAILIIGQLLIEIVLLPLRFLVFVLQGITGEGMMLEEATMSLMPLEEIELDFEELGQVGDYSIIVAIGRFLAIVVLVVVVAAVLGTLFYRLYMAFLRKHRPEKQSLMPEDVITKLKFVMTDFKELLPRFRLGAKHPIRRAYIKKVNNHVKQGLEVRRNYTPEVIADKIRPKEDIDELTQRYEEIRYGRG